MNFFFYSSYFNCHRTKVLSSHTISAFRISCLNMLTHSSDWILNPMSYNSNMCLRSSSASTSRISIVSSHPMTVSACFWCLLQERCRYTFGNQCIPREFFHPQQKWQNQYINLFINISKIIILLLFLYYSLFLIFCDKSNKAKAFE